MGRLFGIYWVPMRIKRLELYGFKTFPNRTVLVFPPGISAIVGPNGSGKSNIVDALRWILGEQNPRQLRVREMVDLIFAGENGRRPDFAEVKLILENEDHRGPKDLAHLSEIMVARRLYRDGESEFFLNNRPCRLKDIVFLFLDTGAHARGYGIIDQGQVGQFVEQSPKERRRFLEDLAGVARYKLKREETERQLARSRENLTRLKDILAEVERRLEELKAQAEKTKAYQRLKQKIRELELSRLDLLYAKEAERREKIARKMEALREEGKSLLREKEALEPEKEEKLARLLLLRERLKGLEALSQKREEEAKGAEEGLEELLRRERDLAREVARLKGELSGKLEREEAIRQRLKDILREGEKIKEEISQKRAQQEDLKAKHEKLRDKRKGLGEALKGLEKELLTLTPRLEALEREKKGLSAELSKLKREEEALREKKEALLARKEKNRREKVEALAKKKALQEEVSRLKKEKEALEAEIARGKSSWATLREEESLLRLKAKELTQEIEWLRRFLAQNLSEAGKILKKHALSAKALFEVIELDPEEERLCELAFPELLKALWLPKKEEREKALFLLSKEDLSALIYLGEEPKAFIRNRLARITQKDALEPEEGKLVLTPSGHLLEPDGLLRLKGKTSLGLLGKQRELKEKEKVLSQVRKTLKLKEEASLSLERELKEKGQRLKRLTQNYEALKAELKTLEKRLNSLSLEEERFSQEEGFLAAREEELRERQKALSERLSALERERAALLDHREDLSRKKAPLERELRLLDKELKAISAQLRALELAVSAAKERLRQGEREKERLLKEETLLARDLERLKRRLEEKEKTLSEVKLSLSQVRKKAQEKKEEAERVRREVLSVREEVERLEEDWRGLNAKLQEKEAALSALEKRLNRLEVDLAEVDLSLRHLREQARERFEEELPLKKRPKDLPLKRLEADILEARRALEALGAVNLTALEELETTQERHRFLLEQKADLEKAIADLEEAVRQINRESRKRLREALAAANEKLAEVFPLLFPGGRAELRFAESNDPLEAGLDLWVSLPGKPIRHLSMLSGGEKALTALAVLCAFYLVKPGPFCVLDEVDAPLDEANTERFVKLLRELNRYSQIILVTHNKQVMEAADTLIGVTMEEKGVSKIVSVNLT